jgi:uncharacterized protein
MTQAVAPVDSGERISSLDALRGFALLGILLMNIVGFGLHHAYDNPAANGGDTGLNLAAWVTMHILAEGKMRCLFSMVFGAGVVLLTGRAEERGGGGQIADIVLRRNLWLVLFGIFHAYLLWFGDILYPYGLCGLVLYPFRRLSPKALLTIGAATVVLTAGLNIAYAFSTLDAIRKGKEAEGIAKSGAKLTEEQEEARKKWEKIQKDDRPSKDDIEKANNRWRGSPAEVLKIRGEMVWGFHGIPFYHPWMLDIFSMMFLGMGFHKLGIFSASRSNRFYAMFAATGYLIGISVNTTTAIIIVRSGFDLPTRLFCSTVYDVGRLSVALGHVGVLMLLCKAGALRFLLHRLGAIGQMAFSNYILHSVICSVFFTGIGFGMFGRLQRYELYYVVAAIWVLQMIVSPIWLKHYRFGPLEWCWRSLTYWKKQPMRIEQSAPAAIAASA